MFVTFVRAAPHITVTKIATGWYAGSRAGVGVPGRFRAGFALVARGEFSIVIAGLAVASSAVEPALAPLATAYVLITVVTGPVLSQANGACILQCPFNLPDGTYSLGVAEGRYLLEFVDPTDPMADRLLANKPPGMHGDYRREVFERLLEARGGGMARTEEAGRPVDRPPQDSLGLVPRLEEIAQGNVLGLLRRHRRGYAVKLVGVIHRLMSSPAGANPLRSRATGRTVAQGLRPKTRVL